MSLRSRVIGFGVAFVLVLAGVAGGVGFRGTFGQILALVLIGLGLVLATGLVFYEVGLSEDRERAGEEAARRSQEARRRERERKRPPERDDGRVRRRRLERRRGQRRRLR
jgi:hypothetical protein